MFGKAFKIGTLLGFRIEISITFFFILALLMFTSGVLGGLMLVGLLFGSVLVHELGHAVVARRLGVRILGIELHFFGGAAKMSQPPRTAREEIIVAIAGPLTSFGLAGLAWVLALATGWAPIKLLAFVNLILGVFNLLPALPMDGGRVLRAVLSERMGRYRATHVAATVAQVLAVLLAVVGIVTSQWHLIALTVLLWFMAAQERAMAGMWRYADEAPQPQVLDQWGRVIAGPPGGHPGPPGPAQPRAEPGGNPAAGPVRRVYRLPNGTIMVVEEHVRW